MTNYWLSWYANKDDGPFTLHWPWWIGGHRVEFVGDDTRETPSICAAVAADTETDARAAVLYAHDRPPERIEWRFCEARPDDWTPYRDRFPKADWMPEWPPSTPIPGE